MSFSYENQGTHTYLVYTVAQDDMIDSMSLGMLTNNKINGLAPTLFTQMDATKFIKYDVSAKISVKQFFTGQVNKKRLIGVFNGIVDAMLSAEDYMIDVNSILLDLDFIFADVSTCETVLICMPIISDDLSVTDLGMFFRNIMFTTQFDQTENCDHVAKIINYLNSVPVFSLTDFKSLLESIDGNGYAAPAPQPAVQQPVVQQAQQPVVQKPQETVQVPVQQAPAQPKPQITAQQPVQPAAPAPQPAAPQNPVAMPNGPVSMPNGPINMPKGPVAPVPQPANNQGGEEKKVSMMDLLMHYSKENVELYKKQKAAKKAGQMGTIATPAPQQKPQSAPSGMAFPGSGAPAGQGMAFPGSSAPANQGIAFPGSGAPANQGMAFPGSSAPANQGMAFPGSSAPAQQPKVTPQPAASAPAPQPTAQPAAQPVYNPAETPHTHSANFGETTVLSVSSGVGETTVLGVSAAAQPTPHLIRSKNNEKINLNKPVFRIGKERSYVDYFIGDNSAISRSHANIITRDGEYFVVDTNSTNHTYVNGQMIQSNEEVKIAHGTMIKFANEDFEFKLY